MNDNNVTVPPVNQGRPDFEYLPGNGMWRVQLPRTEHLFRDEAQARQFAADNGIPTEWVTTPVPPQKHLWEYDHPYYASESNYFSNECTNRYDSWADFFAEFGDADMDYNLLIRWDWFKQDPRGDFDGPTPAENEGLLQLTYVGQRKGLYIANLVKVTEADEPAVREFIAKYWAHMQKLWEGS